MYAGVNAEMHLVREKIGSSSTWSLFVRKNPEKPKKVSVEIF